MGQQPKRYSLTAEQREECARLRSVWDSYREVNPHATQKWLADASGLGVESRFSQFLNAIRPVDLEALLRICRVLDIKPEAISPRLAQLMGPIDPELLLPVSPKVRSLLCSTPEDEAVLSYLRRVRSMRRAAEDLIDTMKSVRALIAEFDAKCEREEHTDSGQAWELFNEISTQLEAAIYRATGE